ncbi:MAG: 8-amino-7-oxononanoate synthase [endosymbiont of Galathealinum brachiosum]|uniref:8-amino-7-ketopelargonate synthase n=1 Tax=endosymbiont of Galathealinum brachiosum TaxID=2200906 RepID=A0A370DE67_9GAMM|nr:MAG: 8-amino-7-oxononanoate synthase [endosymbiont of Galathealinum brachiosum]
MKDLKPDLQQRKQQGLYRSRNVLQSPQDREIILNNKKVLNFCSNDYLGLANHPEVKKAFINAAQKHGVGSGSAHLVNGHTLAHHSLEEELAEFTGFPRALLFSTGYMANLGVAQSICTKQDTIIEDKLNHASLLDAANISNARLKRYLHKNYKNLANKLGSCQSGEKLVSSDSVFSMDGDETDISKLIHQCREHGARLMLDDAHGFGVLGQDGRGSLNHQQINSGDVSIYMATLGKALGTSGAFIAGSEELIETLIQSARCYIYTTAMPPAIAEATRTSLHLLTKENWRQASLNNNINFFKKLAVQAGLNLLESNTAIQPVIIGDSKKATGISQNLFDQGFHVAAIRPPTVPENTARLRITLRADHTEIDIKLLVENIIKITF